MSEQERESLKSKSLSRLRSFCEKRPGTCALVGGLGGVLIGFLLHHVLTRAFDEQAFGIFVLSVIGIICIYLAIISVKKKKLEYVMLLALLVVALIIAIHYVLQGLREEPEQHTLTVWDHIFENGTYTVTLRNYTDTDILMKEEFKNSTLIGVLNVVVKANSCKKFTLLGTYAEGDRVTLTTENGTVVEFTV